MKAKLIKNHLFNGSTNALTVDGKNKICPFQQPLMVNSSTITQPGQAQVVPMFHNCGDHCALFKYVTNNRIVLNCSKVNLEYEIEQDKDIIEEPGQGKTTPKNSPIFKKL